MQLVPVGAFQLPAFGLGEIIGMQRIAQGSHHPGADTRLLLDLAGRALLDPLAAFEVPLRVSPSGRCGGSSAIGRNPLTTTPPAASISANSAAKAPNAAPGSGVTTAALLYDSRIFVTFARDMPPSGAGVTAYQSSPGVFAVKTTALSAKYTV